jgi:hypothetical protein
MNKPKGSEACWRGLPSTFLGFPVSLGLPGPGGSTFLLTGGEPGVPGMGSSDYSVPKSSRDKGTTSFHSQEQQRTVGVEWGAPGTYPELCAPALSGSLSRLAASVFHAPQTLQCAGGRWGCCWERGARFWVPAAHQRRSACVLSVSRKRKQLCL